MEVKKTITSIFMLPTLKMEKKKLIDNGFINAYIKDENQEFTYPDSIYVLFKPSDMDLFKVFVEEEYERTDQLIEDYDYAGGYVVLVYKLDNKYKKDFDLVRLGKYSLTSNKFQKLFPTTVKIQAGRNTKEEISLQYRIFNKTEDLVKFWEDRLAVIFSEDQEVWHGFDETKEVLDLNKIKEYV